MAASHSSPTHAIHNAGFAQERHPGASRPPPPPRLQRVKGPDTAELGQIIQLISQRVARSLTPMHHSSRQWPVN